MENEIIGLDGICGCYTPSERISLCLWPTSQAGGDHFVCVCLVLGAGVWKGSPFLVTVPVAFMGPCTQHIFFLVLESLPKACSSCHLSEVGEGDSELALEGDGPSVHCG